MADHPVNPTVPLDVPLEQVLKPQQQQQQQPSQFMPAPTQNLSHETREAMQDWEIAALRREVIELQTTVDGLSNDKEKAMRWGLLALGTAVIGMGTWIFNFLFTHLSK